MSLLKRYFLFSTKIIEIRKTSLLSSHDLEESVSQVAASIALYLDNAEWSESDRKEALFFQSYFNLDPEFPCADLMTRVLTYVYNTVLKKLIVCSTQSEALAKVTGVIDNVREVIVNNDSNSLMGALNDAKVGELAKELLKNIAANK